MPNVQHKDLSGANLHEPKGVESADAGKVYVANGSTSGEWKKISPLETIDAPALTAGKVITSNGANGANFGVAVWSEISGSLVSRPSGATTPTLTAYKGDIWQYAFDVGDEVFIAWHIPHDYKINSDIWTQVHWSHNDATSISGSIIFTFEACYAKSHNQAIFGPNFAFSTPPYNTVSLATTPQYRHRVEDYQLSSISPNGNQIDSRLLEPDGLIMAKVTCPTQPTFGGGGKVFIHTVDIKYQIDSIGTLNRKPPFYA